MLDFMRRNARSWGIKIAFGIISLTMVFFLGGGGGLMGSSRPLATVGNLPVTAVDFERTRNRTEAYFRDQFGGQITPEMRKALDIPGMALRQLVDAAALQQEADSLGLRIPDEAVADAIREIEVFQVDGRFSPSQYNTLLRNQGMSPATFEEQMRKDLLSNQLTELVKVGVNVREDEAWEDYKRENRKIALKYVTINGVDFEEEVTVDEEGLTEFFDNNTEDYRRPETVRVRYIAYTADAFADKIDVSDEAIEEYYELNAETEFTREEEVTARHILKKIDAEASDEDKDAARAALQAVIDRIEAGEDFAELAKTESEDPGSGARGGDLGSFGRGRMVPPFEEAAFALEVGGRSDIVESSFGFHFIEVTAKQEAGQTPLEDVRDDIRAIVAKREAADTIFDAAASDGAAISDGAKLSVIAEERGLEIAETPLVSKGDIVPGIGAAPKFVDAALSLEEPGDTSDAVKAAGNYYILELAERKPSYLPELAEAREDVVKDYRSQLAIEMAVAKADTLLTAARDGKSLDEIAEENSTIVTTTDAFPEAARFIPGIGVVNGLQEAAFATSEDGELLGRTFSTAGKAFIFQREALTEPERSAFDDEKDARIARLRAAREQEVVGEFLRELKEGMTITYDQGMLGQYMPQVPAG